MRMGSLLHRICSTVISAASSCLAIVTTSSSAFSCAAIPECRPRLLDTVQQR